MNHRRVAFLAVVALIVLAVTAWAQNPKFLRGDVNADGVVNQTDVDELNSHVFMFTAVACTLATDVNDDGSVNAIDVGQLGNYVNNGTPLPAPPFPNCGEDPTPTPGTSCCAVTEAHEPIPSLSAYGIGVLVLLMIASALVVWRRKRAAAHA